MDSEKKEEIKELSKTVRELENFLESFWAMPMSTAHASNIKGARSGATSEINRIRGMLKERIADLTIEELLDD